MDRLQALVAEKMIVSFGPRPVNVRAMKFSEEAGELMGALVRREEMRDGKDWEDEIRKEMGDVMVTLLALASVLGLSLEDVMRDGVDSFLDREWNIGRKA